MMLGPYLGFTQGSDRRMVCIYFKRDAGGVFAAYDQNRQPVAGDIVSDDAEQWQLFYLYDADEKKAVAFVLGNEYLYKAPLFFGNRVSALLRPAENGPNHWTMAFAQKRATDFGVNAEKFICQQAEIDRLLTFLAEITLPEREQVMITQAEEGDSKIRLAHENFKSSMLKGERLVKYPHVDLDKIRLPNDRQQWHIIVLLESLWPDIDAIDLAQLRQCLLAIYQDEPLSRHALNLNASVRESMNAFRCALFPRLLDATFDYESNLESFYKDKDGKATTLVSIRVFIKEIIAHMLKNLGHSVGVLPDENGPVMRCGQLLSHRHSVIFDRLYLKENKIQEGLIYAVLSSESNQAWLPLFNSLISEEVSYRLDGKTGVWINDFDQQLTAFKQAVELDQLHEEINDLSCNLPWHEGEVLGDFQQRLRDDLLKECDNKKKRIQAIQAMLQVTDCGSQYELLLASVKGDVSCFQAALKYAERERFSEVVTDFIDDEELLDSVASLISRSDDLVILVELLQQSGVEDSVSSLVSRVDHVKLREHVSSAACFRRLLSQVEDDLDRQTIIENLGDTHIFSLVKDSHDLEVMVSAFDEDDAPYLSDLFFKTDVDELGEFLGLFINHYDINVRRQLISSLSTLRHLSFYLEDAYLSELTAHLGVDHVSPWCVDAESLFLLLSVLSKTEVSTSLVKEAQVSYQLRLLKGDILHLEQLILQQFDQDRGPESVRRFMRAVLWCGEPELAQSCLSACRPAQLRSIFSHETHLVDLLEGQDWLSPLVVYNLLGFSHLESLCKSERDYKALFFLRWGMAEKHHINLSDDFNRFIMVSLLFSPNVIAEQVQRVSGSYVASVVNGPSRLGRYLNHLSRFIGSASFAQKSTPYEFCAQILSPVDCNQMISGNASHLADVFRKALHNSPYAIYAIAMLVRKLAPFVDQVEALTTVLRPLDLVATEYQFRMVRFFLPQFVEQLLSEDLRSTLRSDNAYRLQVLGLLKKAGVAECVVTGFGDAVTQSSLKRSIDQISVEAPSNQNASGLSAGMMGQSSRSQYSGDKSPAAKR